MSTLWVFGYGSLIWNPGFEYKQCKVGSIKGYARRFWQGNDVHRGNPKRLGRVATLIEEQGAVTWGKAFQFIDKESTLTYLSNRESSQGGYSSFITEFYSRDPNESPFPVLVYIALPCNPLFLGPAPMEQLALDIAFSKGECGHNIEYLAKLSSFMRFQVPDFLDDHLFQLERLVRLFLTQSNDAQLLNLFSSICEYDFDDDMNLIDAKLMKLSLLLDDDKQSDADDRSTSESSPSSSSSSSSSVPSKFTDMVPSRKLKCLNL